LQGRSGLPIDGTEADFALLSRVDSLEILGAFVEATKDEAGRRTGGPWCNYTVTLRGSTRYYRLANLRALPTIPLAGSKQLSFESSSRQCRGSEVPASATQEAAQDAVRRARTEVKNPLAARGYVDSARSNGRETLFRISVGPGAMLGPDARLHLYTLRRTTNQLTGATELEEVQIAEATLTDQSGDGFAWIRVDGETAARVRIGDFARVSFEKGIFERATGVDPMGLLPGVGSR
jgi:hypothetical protein